MKIRFKGTVKKQTGRGKKLGYPTANIEAPSDAEEGIFVGYTRALPPLTSPPSLREGEKERGLPSIIFIGAPEMFGETDKRLEAHILDFDGELYGQDIAVEIVRKLRENQKFESKSRLLQQMKQDEQHAREYFSRKFPSPGVGRD